MLEIRVVHVSFCVHFHGTKFYEHETPAFESDTRLPVKNRPRRSNGDPERAQSHDRQPEGEQQRDDEKVEQAFPYRQGGCEFFRRVWLRPCLLYTSDAADERSSVD